MSEDFILDTQKELEDLQAEFNDLGKRINALNEKAYSGLRSFIKEKKLLYGTKWKLADFYSLQYVGEQKDIEPLKQFLEANKNYRLYLTDAKEFYIYQMGFNYIIDVYSKDFSVLVHEYGMIIDSSVIDAEIDTLKQTLLEYQAIKDSCKV